MAAKRERVVNFIQKLVGRVKIEGGEKTEDRRFAAVSGRFEG